jgi:retinol dehydrogenase-12
MVDEAILTGRVCVVTGASSGIGKETARQLARRGATVVMICRDRERGLAAQAEVGREASCPPRLLLADLLSFAEIRRVATEVRALFPALHVLVNNAGAIFGHRELTVDGQERTFALNHLAYFLLTGELLDALRRGAPARVVNVASAAHRVGSIHFADLSLARCYTPFRAYSQSKLANILFTRELARRLEGSGVTANCLHPGTIATNFGQSGSRPFALLVRLARPFLPGPVRGAETSVHLAASPEGARVTGQYFVRCRVATPSRRARDPELARRLWEVSEEICGVSAADGRAALTGGSR